MTNSQRPNGSEIAVYLGLGSNIGDREGNLREAVARIKAVGIEIKNESSVYETEPVGFTDQPWFLNQVIETKISNVLICSGKSVSAVADPETISTIEAEAVLSELLKIENAMGRERVIANGPRVIDIDLLFFGDKVIAHTKDDEEWPFIGRTDVFVPHPRMHLRRFVLEPLCEIAPGFVHPVLRKTCHELLASLEDDSKVRIYRQRNLGG